MRTRDRGRSLPGHAWVCAGASFVLGSVVNLFLDDSLPWFAYVGVGLLVGVAATAGFVIGASYGGAGAGR